MPRSTVPCARYAASDQRPGTPQSLHCAQKAFTHKVHLDWCSAALAETDGRIRGGLLQKVNVAGAQADAAYKPVSDHRAMPSRAGRRRQARRVLGGRRRHDQAAAAQHRGGTGGRRNPRCSRACRSPRGRGEAEPRYPRNGRKNARTSSASASGSSIAAKWPPRDITVQRWRFV